MPVLRFFVLPALAWLLSGESIAAPSGTKYYSLDVPSDWGIVKGPSKEKDAVTYRWSKNHKNARSPSQSVRVIPARRILSTPCAAPIKTLFPARKNINLEV
ncbi:MAG: hypothetical protein ZNDK_0041 [Candidatus Desulfovibrio kirbyi]|jgi:hypothetical protein|uniref:Uncharacterized protein n=1 Tax=Candidatus Desulfovibrio kirbyi TaxID=2696086 RepID=A0A6L2R3X0_9BACT|nr:hypothetical protein [Desulfovibrio sp.]GFH62270.1 MAG: hypothetical protein ZNDK_0041 [Candidatus Desulfovibrio kirbyi]